MIILVYSYTREFFSKFDCKNIIRFMKVDHLAHITIFWNVQEFDIRS